LDSLPAQPGKCFSVMDFFLWFQQAFHGYQPWPGIGKTCLMINGMISKRIYVV
jgi:hypothetical protein